METSPTAVRALVDLWQSIVKILGRPAVQHQLWAGLTAVLFAWLLAHGIVGRMRKRYAARMQEVRAQLTAEAESHLAEPDEGPSDDRAFYVALLGDEAALNDAAKQRLGLAWRVVLLVLPVVFPLLAILFLYAAYVVFVAQQRYSGLLAGLISLLALYFVYRLLLGVAFALGNDARVAHYQRWLFGPLVVVSVILLVIDLVGNVRTLASATVFPAQQGWLTIGAIFVATFGFYAWFVLTGLIKELLHAAVSRRSGRNAGSLDAGLTLLQYGLIGLGLFVVFRVLQVNAATVAAITGGLSIGIGFALQDVLRNFLGGIIVLFEGSVRPGDWVEIAGSEGEVDKMSIRSTIVRSPGDVEYIVPNQQWLNSVVTTYTKSSRRVQIRVPVSVTGDIDPRAVQELLVDTARQLPDVLAKPRPAAPLVQFGASRADFVVHAWVKDASVKNNAGDDLRLRIWDVLAANNIEAA